MSTNKLTPVQESENRYRLEETHPLLLSLEAQVNELKVEINKINCNLDNIASNRDSALRLNAKLEAIKAIIEM